MTEQQIDKLRDLSRRYIHLLGELHAGNEFSKEQLWKWLNEAAATLKIGSRVKFKTSGHEIADIRNPNPEPFAYGTVNGEPVLNYMVAGGGYVPLWCERENREPTTVYVCFDNIVQDSC
jgi:hypothetical protein